MAFFDYGESSEKPLYVFIIDWGIAIIFILDIFLNMRVAYIDPKTDDLVTDNCKMLKHYVNSVSFIIDFSSSIPFDFFKLGFNFGFLKVMKIFKLLRMLRLKRFQLSSEEIDASLRKMIIYMGSNLMVVKNFLF